MPGPIRHIVMWRLRGDTAEERAAARLRVKDAFEGLKGLIKGLNHIEVGLDVSDVDYACDVVLLSEFANSAALKAYATHPEHLRCARNSVTYGSGAFRSTIRLRRPARDRFVHFRESALPRRFRQLMRRVR